MRVSMTRKMRRQTNVRPYEFIQRVYRNKIKRADIVLKLSQYDDVESKSNLNWMALTVIYVTYQQQCEMALRELIDERKASKTDDGKISALNQLVTEAIDYGDCRYESRCSNKSMLLVNAMNKLIQSFGLEDEIVVKEDEKSLRFERKDK